MWGTSGKGGNWITIRVEKLISWRYISQQLYILDSRPLKSQILDDYKAMKRWCMKILRAETNAIISKIWLYTDFKNF